MHKGLIAAFVFAAFHGHSADIRVVNGVSVDLAPVTKWLKTKNGERPFPHWKQFSLRTIKGYQVGCDLCSVKDEGDEALDILILHLPATLRAQTALVARQKWQIASLRHRIELGSAYAERQRADWFNPNLTHADQDANYYNSRLTKMNVDEAKAALAKLESKQESDTKKLASDSNILAVSTGKKNGKVEIWDCGIVKTN